MKYTAIVALSFLVSCATHKPENLDHKPLPLAIQIPNTSLILTLALGNKTSTEENFADSIKSYGPQDRTSSRYTLSNPKKETIVGTAESAIVLSDIQGGVFRGVRTVEASSDGSQILINEEVSDASPAVRYILFKQQPDGTYKTVYLAPAEIKEPAIVEFGYYLPTIHLKDEGFDRMPTSEVPFTRG